MLYSFDNLVLPFTTNIRDPVAKGTEIQVIGKVRLNDYHDNRHCFVIDLLSYPNVVLHLSFRHKGNHHIAVNSCNFYIYGWEEEKRLSNPLKDGSSFDLQILVLDTHYEIHLNGKFLTNFKHRYPYQSVHAVGAHGEATVDKVIIKTPGR